MKDLTTIIVWITAFSIFMGLFIGFFIDIWLQYTNKRRGDEFMREPVMEEMREPK